MNRRISRLSCFLLVILILTGCSKPADHAEYLKTVLKNLESITSATYFSEKEAFAPADTIASVKMDQLIKEFNNPSDTTIGASYISFLSKDTSQMTFCYDGKMRSIVYEEDKRIVIDSFNVTRLPFRPLSPPFFNYTKSIIRYALETKDSIFIDIKEQNGSVYFGLTIREDQQVEFFGKAFYCKKDPYDSGETSSKYEIWIDKATNLPYRCRREMSHMTSEETVCHVSLNKLKMEDFHASDYFMPGYEIVAYRSDSNPVKHSEMIGKNAPDWTLPNVSGNELTLSDLKGKVVMIQFTSVTCGPCRASVPFLNQLQSACHEDDFTFLAIECTSHSLNALKSYKKRYSISYKLLLSNGSVLKNYNIKSFPVFFFLDKDLIIREVIYGYGVAKTDTEITSILDKMTKLSENEE